MNAAIKLTFTLMLVIGVAIPLTAQTTAPIASPEPAVETESAEATFSGPALVSTVGRADGTIVNVICRRAGVEVTLLEEITADDFEGVAALILAMGGSAKGLGAAGVDPDAELARGEAALAAAAEAGVPVLGIHVGGEPRRGEISDPFCEIVANTADAIVVKQGGNGDGFFTEIAAERGIPLIEVDTNGAAIQAIGELFE